MSNMSLTNDFSYINEHTKDNLRNENYIDNNYVENKF